MLSENRLKKAEGKPAVKKILTPKAKSDIAIEAIKAQLTWAQLSSNRTFPRKSSSFSIDPATRVYRFALVA